MYVDGIKIGEKTYLLAEENGELKIATGSSNTEEMEEYLKLNNEYDEKMEEKNNLQQRLSDMNQIGRDLKRANLDALIATIIVEGMFIICIALGNIGLAGTITLLGFPLVVCGPILAIFKSLIYGTKEKRAKRKQETSKELERVQEELKELKNKIDGLNEKIEYSEMELYEDEIVSVITEENKKANVKMRVLRLDSSNQ